MKKKILITLFIATNLLASTNYDDSIILHKRVQSLLEEEKIRWKKIHETPYSDKIEIEQLEDRMIVRLEIDASPYNIINREPIKRTYEFPKDTIDKPVLLPVTFGVAAGYSYGQNISPIVYVGLNPIKQFPNIYIGIYTTVLSLGGAVYYRNESLYKLTFICGVGYNIYNQISPSVGIGISF